MFTREDLVYAYTRKQAIDDGEQVDVSSLAKEAGFKYPVFVTRAVFDSCITPDEQSASHGQGETGRLWDVLTMLRYAVQHKMFEGASASELIFGVLFVRDRRKKKVELKANVGALDIDDPQPAITIMLPGED